MGKYLHNWIIWKGNFTNNEKDGEGIFNYDKRNFNILVLLKVFYIIQLIKIYYF